MNKDVIKAMYRLAPPPLDEVTEEAIAELTGELKTLRSEKSRTVRGRETGKGSVGSTPARVGNLDE